MLSLLTGFFPFQTGGLQFWGVSHARAAQQQPPSVCVAALSQFGVCRRTRLWVSAALGRGMVGLEPGADAAVLAPWPFVFTFHPLALPSAHWSLGSLQPCC